MKTPLSLLTILLISQTSFALDLKKEINCGTATSSNGPLGEYYAKQRKYFEKSCEVKKTIKGVKVPDFLAYFGLGYDTGNVGTNRMDNLRMLVDLCMDDMDRVYAQKTGKSPDELGRFIVDEKNKIAFATRFSAAVDKQIVTFQEVGAEYCEELRHSLEGIEMTCSNHVAKIEPLEKEIQALEAKLKDKNRTSSQKAEAATMLEAKMDQFNRQILEQSKKVDELKSRQNYKVATMNGFHNKKLEDSHAALERAHSELRNEFKKALKAANKDADFSSTVTAKCQERIRKGDKFGSVLESGVLAESRYSIDQVASYKKKLESQIKHVEGRNERQLEQAKERYNREQESIRPRAEGATLGN